MYILMLLACGAGAQGDPGAASPFAPSTAYESQTIEGWTVLVLKDFPVRQPDLAAETLMLLRVHLYQITRRLPPDAVKKLRQVRIWVEENEPHHPCMAYHPDASWLREHDMNPEKAKCVELANARNFLQWTHDQPWMVLHELAHAYHHQFLEEGFENAAVRDAFEDSLEAGRYDSVQRINGRTEKAYAATNPMEYFAELTEAYFGTNDFYPYVRSELERHDAGAFMLLGQLWGK